VLRGRLSGEQLQQCAELAERFGSGSLRATVSQNLVFVDVPTSKAGELARELGQIGLHVDGSTFFRGAVACTGTEFCKLAITETKGFTRWLVDEMEERLPQFDQQLKLHVTGCPNGCGQHWIADVGLEGKKIKHEGKLTDAYYFCLGGAVGQQAAISRTVGYRAQRLWFPRPSSVSCATISAAASRGKPPQLVRPPHQRRTPCPASRRSPCPSRTRSTHRRRPTWRRRLK